MNFVMYPFRGTAKTDVEDLRWRVVLRGRTAALIEPKRLQSLRRRSDVLTGDLARARARRVFNRGARK